MNKNMNHLSSQSFWISRYCWGLMWMSPLVSCTGFSIKRARNCWDEIIRLDKCGNLEKLKVEAGIGGSKHETFNREILGSNECSWASRNSLPSSIMMNKSLLELDNVNDRVIDDWVVDWIWNFRVVVVVDCEIRR